MTKNTNPDPAASDARLSQIRERHEQDAAEYPFALSARIIAGGRCSQLHADVGWLLARLADVEPKASAWDFIAERLDAAHAYCHKHLMPKAWGYNVWHAILEDAIWLRARLDTRECQVKSVLERTRKTANDNYKVKAYGLAEALHYVADALEKLL